MGNRGPAPTPTRLKVLHGETRSSRLNRYEPRPHSPRGPQMPPDMTVRAKQIWRRVMRDFGPTGIVTSADTDVLRAYVEAVARYEQAGAMFDASGPLIRAQGTGARRGELVKNPLAQIVRDQAALLRAMARELGLTPAARTGLTGDPAPVHDPMADLLADLG